MGGEIPKVWIDTNIFVDYFWAEFRKAKSKEEKFKLKLPKPLNYALSLFKKYNLREFEICFNIWSYWELREVIGHQLFQHKCIAFGYQMPRDYHRAINDKVPELEPEELEIFYTVLKYLRNAIPKKNMGYYPLKIEKVSDFVFEGCEFMDSILFFQAMESDCDFFVTRDNNGFYKKLLPFCEKKEIKTKPILVEDFLTRMRPNTCWECGGKMELKHEQHEIGSKPDDEPDGYLVIDYSECEKCGKKIIWNKETI